MTTLRCKRCGREAVGGTTSGGLSVDRAVLDVAAHVMRQLGTQPNLVCENCGGDVEIVGGREAPGPTAGRKITIDGNEAAGQTASRMITIDGNEAAASSAFRINEVIAIYPITPSSNMGEWADEWAAQKRKNVWGIVPEVVEMQSEGGAAGAVHGALQGGALTTTFTASQGLLLMIPNMYKIAGELNAFCMHVAARTLATHALSIFGDHSDVMACRQTGFAMLCSGSLQETHDFAAIASAAALESRVPFLHFFDGFRSSHEVGKIAELQDDDLAHMMDEGLIRAHRARALSPDHPVLRGTAQNPDTFFQSREACNNFYTACPGLVEKALAKFAARTGRAYKLFDYVGHPEAERVIVMMGSGAETAHEAVEWMTAKGEKVGVLKVRLYRPFALDRFMAALPKTVKAISVLDRTKEPGALGDPLYMDVVTALREAHDAGTSPFAKDPVLVGGRYGLSSKEFTPAMVMAVFDDLKQSKPKNHFTLGIVDDVTHLSLKYDETLDIDPAESRAVFFGLGADGTVGANKNSIKIIGEETDNNAQGYFVYDSKKSGAVTISHLRFGPKPIRSRYLIQSANFVACHQFEFIDKLDVLAPAKEGAVFLLNAPSTYGTWAARAWAELPAHVKQQAEKGVEKSLRLATAFGASAEVLWDNADSEIRKEILAPLEAEEANGIWDELPLEMQEQIVAKKLKFYVIDAYSVAKDTGMGTRINTIMQTCFFAISGVLPRDEAIAQIKKAIEKTYGKRGAEVVKRNFAAVDTTLEHLHEVKVPANASSKRRRPPIVSDKAPDFVRKVEAVMLAGKGDLLPVSAFPIDGTWPMGTTQWEKRNIALEIPAWDMAVCIQCNQCALVCPHAAIRAKVYDGDHLAKAPKTFLSTDFKSIDLKGLKYTIQVAPEDCTGCNLCVNVCPAKDKANPKHKAINMVPQRAVREAERENYEFFLALPEIERDKIKRIDVKGSQFFEPLFEYSGACGGCGETPYVKLMTQLFGDRAIIANATGCSSIYSGNLPTTPYTTNRDGRGPAWSNSLFEDNAEFGLGIRLAVDFATKQAADLLTRLSGQIGENLVKELLGADQSDEAGLALQRQRVALLKTDLAKVKGDEARRLESIADYLVKKSVWIVGGDGWAYDIGYGGLDHVIASGRKVNLLVLDTEVYSNTGGQASKATPLGASAKFAMAGKETGKKDLGLLAMSYGNVYVARIAMGAKMNQTVQAFLEADAFPGPSIIIAYSHCIAHGYDMAYGIDQQKLAVDSAVWPLYRFDPRRVATGEPPLKLDSGKAKSSAKEYMQNETRFRMVEKSDPERFKMLLNAAAQLTEQRWLVYEQLAGMRVPRLGGDAQPTTTSKE